MKPRLITALKTLTIILVFASIVGSCYYLFVYDRYEKSLTYSPEIEISFLESETERLLPIKENNSVEEVIKDGRFKAVFILNCSKSSVDEIKENIDSIMKWHYKDRQHFSFNDSSEIVIWEAHYTPIVKALGHGWWYSDGNEYERLYGEEKAEGKPNFRNHFCFTIRKNDEQFFFDIFCNTNDAEKAFSKAVDYINQLNENDTGF